MAKVVRLTESDLNRLVRKVIKEQNVDAIIKCITEKITSGKVQKPPFDISRFAGVVTDLIPVVQACNKGPFAPECMEAGMTFGDRHVKDGVDLLPYVLTNITVLGPCIVSA